MGSPPLVRERPSASAIVWPVSEDHPRSCGKDKISGLHGYCSPGSPPLVRERLKMAEPIPVKTRITPARAGKTYDAVSRKMG